MTFEHPDFTVIRELGRGGSATVYLAVQLSLNRRVALKVLHQVGLLQQREGERFLREARIVARLAHPHIVPVYDVVRWQDDVFFMTMEYLPGGTLKDRLSTISLDALATCVGQVCEALAHMHAQGFVHRDVKPDNVLFRSDNHALLGDFGVARAAASNTQMTVKGTLMGTPDYMSPEQIRGLEVSAASDLYSLGILLFEALSGYRPFEGDTPVATSMQHLTASPRPLEGRLKVFQPLIDQMLEKQPDKRLNEAIAVAEDFQERLRKSRLDLDALLPELRSDKAPPKVVVPAGRQRRRPAAVAAGLAAVVAIAGFGYWWAADAPESLVELEAPPELSAREIRLRDAQESYLAGRWFEPEENSAVRLFSEALADDPESLVAAERLEQIFGAMRARIFGAVSGRRLDEARSLYGQVAGRWGDDPRLVPLAEAIEKASMEQRDAEGLQVRKARIEELLTQAAAGRDPVRRYREVLALEPGQPLAVAGLTSVRERFELDIERLLADARDEEADALLTEFSGVFPDAPAVADLRRQLADVRAEQQARNLLAASTSLAVEDAQAWLDAPVAEADEGEVLLDRIRKLRLELPADDRLAGIESLLADRLMPVSRPVPKETVEADVEEKKEADDPFRGFTSF